MFFQMLYVLLALHFIGDYVFQNDFVSSGKNRHTQLGKQYWLVILPMHGYLHGFLIWAVTNSLTLAAIETVTHIVIDYLKCEKKFGFYMDQFLHVLVKVLIAYLFMYHGL